MIRQILQLAKQARRIELDQERIAFFVFQAIQADYTQAQFDRARMWLLFGDWRFRGNDPTLQWDDLYPSDEQVKEALQRANSDSVIISRHEYNKALQASYKRGYSEGQRSNVVQMTQEHVDQLTKAICQWTK